MKVMIVGRLNGRGWSGWFVILIANILIKGYDQQNFGPEPNFEPKQTHAKF